jgi:hypothetical protein
MALSWSVIASRTRPSTPGSCDELLALELRAALALLAQDALLHDGLRRDAGVVGAGEPAGVVARIRCQRMRMSWIVLFSAWPRCSAAVTLGGGMTME